VLCELSNGDGVSVSVSESRGIIYMSYRGSKDRRVTFICKCQTGLARGLLRQNCFCASSDFLSAARLHPV
jgi:hypothetical protein